jgi:predicted ATPase
MPKSTRSKASAAGKPNQAPGRQGVGYLAVSGYKSILREQSIEIRPLTLLAGANSSGKSSVMQALLLLKQTLEAGYDPGALLLNGSNVKFTSAEQLLTTMAPAQAVSGFSVGVGRERETARTVYFKRHTGRGFDIEKILMADPSGISELRPEASGQALISCLSPELREFTTDVTTGLVRNRQLDWEVARNRCFLELQLKMQGKRLATFGDISEISGALDVGKAIREVIHLPGLRGNPERSYPVTAVGGSFPATFENYAANIIAHWQAEKNEDKLEQLGRNLEKLGLTWRVAAQPINDTQVELRLGRLPHRPSEDTVDMVNIADVGFGASQSLPVLVALLTAAAGQLVYLEQPELHLHPRAQSALAEMLADAAKRGVRIVAETHSDLLILAVQALVAEGALAPDLVKLHWFRRNGDGVTEVISANLDENGAYGDWPEDFADVRLRSEDRYLDAVQSRLRAG